MIHSLRARHLVVFATLLTLLAATSVWAQITSGKIAGSVQDPSGAIVPGATVRVMNVATGTLDSASSDASGNYQFFALQPGTYTLEVSAGGFKTFRREGLLVEADRSMEVRVSLALGQATEVIEVNAGTVLLDANTSSLGTSVDNSRIVDMPVNGRNPMALVTLVPTVKGIGDFGRDLGQQSYQQAGVSIGGGNALASGYLMDGVSNDKFGDSGGQLGFLNTESIQELKVVTNAMAAEYGGTGAGIISVISRSGTNQFRGTVYEYLRNNALNANDFFSNAAGAPIPPNKINQFGGTYGGPIIHNKLFFQANYERGISRTGGSLQVNYAPSEAERRGDFSQTLGPNGQPIAIYDPLTTVTGSNGTPVRTAFPGNTIPANRIAFASQMIIGMYPQANQPGLPFTHASNLYQQGTATFDRNDGNGKIDYNMTDKQRFGFRYGHTTNETLGINFFGRGNLLTNNGGAVRNPRDSASLQYTNALSPSLLIEARIGFNHDGEKTCSPSCQQGGYDITKLGFPASLAPQLQITKDAPVAFPCFNVNDLLLPSQALLGTLGMGTCNGNKIRTGITWANSVSVTKVMKVHTLKLGWERRFLEFFPSTLNAPSFTFTRGFTQGPNPTVASANAGFGLASFLLGYPSTGSATYSAIQAYGAKYNALFAQDDWKVSRRLTLNLGLRWDYTAPVEERFNQLSIFDPNLAVPLQVPGLALKGALAYPGTGSNSRGLTEPNYNHFGPRFGFAYKAGDKYVIRGGYGIIYTALKGVTFSATGYSSTTSMVTSLDNGLTPFNTLSNPFPDGIIKPTGNSLGAATGIGQNVSGQLRDVNVGYAQQWNLTQQFQPWQNWLIELAYLGNKGTHLLSPSANLNQLNPALLSLGNALNQTVTNPFFGVAPAGTTLAKSTVTRQQLLLPYPQFTGVTGGYGNSGDSIYHALTLKVEKRLSNSLSFSMSYAYSKLIDAATLTNGGRLDSPPDTGVVNWYNLRAERAESTNSIRHRVVGSVLWQLPLFRQSNGFVKRALGGWQLNVIPTLESGRPIALSSSVGGRPNVVAGQKVGLDNPTLAAWFNTSGYSIPQPFTFGNSSRTIPGVYSDGIINFDSSLFKDFPIHEKISLQFRAETFNTLNHVTFDIPGTAIGNSQFGVVSAQAPNPGPRRMQLGMRLNF